MSEFLYIYRGGKRGTTPEQMQQETQKWVSWMKDLGAKGNLKNAGHPLQPVGKTVRGEQKAVVDGPFAEAKDLIGGYTIVEAKDISHAVELSMGCPIFANGGEVEVRPIQQFSM